MVVDEAARLHRRVGGRRADEAEAATLELLGEGDRRRRLTRDLREACEATLARGRRERPDQLVERLPCLVERDDRARVADRRLDLRAVADDAGIQEEPLDVVHLEARDRLRVEPREDLAERRTLAQHRDPRQARLERLERQALEQRRLAVHGHAPLVVVVRLVQRVAVTETACGLDRRRHTPTVPHPTDSPRVPSARLGRCRCGRSLWAGRSPLSSRA